MRFLGFFTFFLCVVPLFAFNEMPNFVDPRDKQVYKTVQIGDQRWMAENLRFKLKGTHCYDNNEANCWRYGRLYTWAAAMRLVDFYNSTLAKEAVKKVHDVCPKGWHVPSNKEWKKMKYFVGKKGRSDGVGISLKASDGWDVELRIPEGSDEFGFNALPAGERHYIGMYMDMGSATQYWASNEYDAYGAFFWRMTYDSRTFDKVYESKDNEISVRCVEDKLYEIKEPPPPPVVVVPQIIEVQSKKISTIHIGDQVWMAENLNVIVPGSFCYGDDKGRCDKYGRLYTWAAAMNLPDYYAANSARDTVRRNHRGVCPLGWHIPDIYDFERLNAYIQDIDDAVGVGTNLKARDVWPEAENALPGENGWGFSALPSGYRLDLMSFVGADSVTGFWSASEKDSISSLLWSLYYDADELMRDSSNKVAAFPVRCVMDPPGVDEIYDSTAIYDVRDENRYKTVQIGDRTWMAENLRYAAPGSFCYEDKDIRCRSYGRLYPWHVAMRLPEDYLDNATENGVMQVHQGVCPDGWHMPKREDWMSLGQAAINLRKGSVAAVLKTRDGWTRGGVAITEASGFKAIPAGARYSDGEFAELGSSAYFWEASGGDGAGAGYWNLLNSKDEFVQMEDFEHSAFSVRCVKDAVAGVKMKRPAKGETPAETAPGAAPAAKSAEAKASPAETAPSAAPAETAPSAAPAAKSAEAKASPAEIAPSATPAETAPVKP